MLTDKFKLFCANGIHNRVEPFRNDGVGDKCKYKKFLFVIDPNHFNHSLNDH